VQHAIQGLCVRIGTYPTHPSATPRVREDDEQLVRLVQIGDDAATDRLLSRYRNFVRLKAKSYFLMGGDREDLIQEGMIGLYKAIRDYRHDRAASFRVFAEICVTRQMITAIKTATRQKHSPLNSAVSLSKPMIEDEDDRTLIDTLPGTEMSDPVQLVIGQEEMQSLSDDMRDSLSTLESQVLRLYIDGKSYQEIALGLKRHIKSIDNALQRVKRKVEIQLRRRNSC
jgi:RNA polymerase sporulation-specific sigma factor